MNSQSLWILSGEAYYFIEKRKLLFHSMESKEFAVQVSFRQESSDIGTISL